MRLSFSSIDTYENCGLKWYYQYRESLPGVPSPSLSFGSSIHAALESFYKRPVPVAPSLDELLDALDRGWVSEGYADAVEEETYRAQAREVLTRFHAENARSYRLPAAVEERFEFDVEGVRVSGQIDRLDRHDDGTYEVIDYKTNRKLPNRSRVDESLQLSIYHLAAREVWGVEPTKLTLYFVMQGQRISTSRTPEQLERTRARIANVASRIEEGMFEPRPNPLCGWCSYQAICPAMRHRREQVEGPSDAQVAAKLDEWIALDRRMREDAARRDALAAEILSFALEHGYQRLWASDGTGIEPHLAEVGTSLDREDLRRALEPLGLWEDALAIDPTRLATLVRSGKLPPDIERRLVAATEAAARRWTLRTFRESRPAEAPSDPS